MDRKAIIVLTLSVALLFSWYFMVGRIFPPRPVPVNTNTIALASNRAGTLTNQPGLSAATNLAPLLTSGSTNAVRPNQPEETIVLSNAVARYTFTSHGGGLKLVELLKYPQRVACRGQVSTNAPA